MMTTEIHYNLARAADAERIASMSRTLIEAGLGWRWTPTRVERHIRYPDSNLVVARSEYSLVGFALMQFFNDEAHLLLLAVTPPYQRHGIGKRLLAWQEKSARVAGIGRIQLEVRLNNYAAQSFYRALGYRTERLLPGYYSGRENALRMARELRAPVV